MTGVDAFPYTGNAAIIGSLAVTADTGNVEFSYINVIPSAWSVGGALSIARYGLAGAGTQNAGLAFGGNYFGRCNSTEEYNGSSWSAGGALITARCVAGAGEQNAGLAFGGEYFAPVSCTEEYNGTSWTAGGALSTARYYLAGVGTQNAALAFGGTAGPFGLACTEEYSPGLVNTKTFDYSCSTGDLRLTGDTFFLGQTNMVGALSVTANTGNVEFYYGVTGAASWSAGGALITARCFLTGAGTQNAGLAFGGFVSPAVVSCTEEYDGSSWAAGGALITGRCSLAGAGTQNEGLAFGGYVSPSGNSSCTEEYNQHVWTASNPLITARKGLAGAGTQNAGLAFGGYVSPAAVS